MTHGLKATGVRGLALPGQGEDRCGLSKRTFLSLPTIWGQGQT